MSQKATYQPRKTNNTSHQWKLRRGGEEYVVEEILDSSLRPNKLEFLVKWEGYTNENNLWEPEDNCRNACNAIAAV